MEEEGAEQAERGQRKLAWAAQLHEIGLRISHSEYHKHGAYILEHADAMGFALTEMHHLGQLVLGHRGKLRKLELQLDDPGFVRQLLALRLAVILCHARRDPDSQGLDLSISADRDDCFILSCRTGWTESFPQSAHLLREEVEAWSKTRWALRLRSG